MEKSKKYYEANIKSINQNIKEFEKVVSLIGWARLIILIITAMVSFYLYKTSTLSVCTISAIIGIIIFLFVVNVHGKKIEILEKFNVALEFNDKGIKRINGDFREFTDIGKDLVSDDHPFANDLDIFGNNSLFQMINTTKTRSGRNKLGKMLLLEKLPDKNEIIKKQEAIKELCDKVKWRQDLYVNSTFKKSKSEELDELIKWCESENKSAFPKIIISCIFIAITFSMVFMAIVNIIPLSYLILDFMINFAIIKLLSRDKGEAIYLFHTMKYNVKAYSNILIAIDDEEFKSEYLNNLKKNMDNGIKGSCKIEMKKLSNLLEWVGDSAGNAYFFILNILFFADVFILYNLNKWKDKNGDSLKKWLDIMGEFEALSSISNLAFDNDTWCYSEISENNEVCASDMAHPLIGDRAVSNCYELKNPKKITLITGSNMSGKSTFLRTVGINLVLTYIGAPARAKSFRCGIMSIYTCMRTKDNLEESISSFYAEILRIKLIIEACKSNRKVFFLLDEIFKGTNSKDRHTGATVLIRQLAQNNAVGLLSTHDLELCDLEKEMLELQNYNFREYYEDNKIKFDYKLRKGKSETQNAVYLMKLAGIEIN